MLEQVRTLLNRYKSIPFSRKNVFIRDRYTCQYCGLEYENHRGLTIDHIVPKSRGGERRSFENCVTSCPSCNNIKNCQTPEEAKMLLLTQPKKPNIMEFIIAKFGITDEKSLTILQYF